MAPASAARGATPGIVSLQRFRKDARAICKAANEERSDQAIALLERRAEETGEPLGTVGEFEVVRNVVVPSLRREIEELEQIGLPSGKPYEAEALWQTLRIVLYEVEAEGIYAWRSAKLLPTFRNRARPFGLELCIVN